MYCLVTVSQVAYSMDQGSPSIEVLLYWLKISSTSWVGTVNAFLSLGENSLQLANFYLCQIENDFCDNVKQITDMLCDELISFFII